MGDYLTPEEIGSQLGVLPKTVRDWLRSGDLTGIKVGKSWRVHARDLATLLEERLLVARIERVQRLHPDKHIRRGQCCRCGNLIPVPVHAAHWACSPECKIAYDTDLAALVGRGTAEFAGSSSQVAPR